MNFYIGESLQEYKTDTDVEFSDELADYICKAQPETNISLNSIYDIDLYSDVVIPYGNLAEIINACEAIDSERLLEGFSSRDEGYQMVRQLRHIAQKAFEENASLISIGD